MIILSDLVALIAWMALISLIIALISVISLSALIVMLALIALNCPEFVLIFFQLSRVPLGLSQIVSSSS